MSIKILGVHSGHDASATLIDENKVITAISKERITRKKHDSGDPIQAVDYILKNNQLDKNDIDLVVRSNWYDSKELNDEFYIEFPNVITTYLHHDLHAWSSTTVAVNLPCLILVIDGRGCRPIDLGIESDSANLFEVESVYLYDGNQMTCIEKRWGEYQKNKYSWGSHIDSCGYAYAAVSKIIFGTSTAAGKIMALAAMGKENTSIPTPFLYKNSQFKVNEEWLKYIDMLPNPLHWTDSLAADLSYSIQMGLENYLLNRIKELTQKYKVYDICFSGGTALNCKFNGIISQQSWINSFNVYNAPGDDGLSLGAALWARNELYNFKHPIQVTIDTGSTYFKDELTISDELIEEIARIINDGYTIGIFIGGSEFGPRALGHRSIFAAPFHLEMKDYLNSKIKLREAFRPFGAGVLLERLQDITEDKFASYHMLSAVRIKTGWEEKYPALLHIDKTVRLQVIDQPNSLFARVLREFEKLSGCPFIINTSFNGNSEPIVETPDDALKSAKNIGLDYLYLNKNIIKLK